MEPNFLAKLTEYGLAGIVIGILFIVLIKILIWVMKWVDKQSDNHIKERETWQKQNEINIKIVEQISEAVKKHDEKADERGRFVREEHLKFLENQQKIIAAVDKTCSCLDDVKEGLLRVNGHKI